MATGSVVSDAERRARDLLASLAKARWSTAGRVLGNCHATLIGVVVDWWVSSDPEADRWAWEPGCSLRADKQAAKAEQRPDALLCEGADAAGLLEVEGSKPTDAAAKIGRYLAADKSPFDRVRFAILVVYAYQPKGRGSKRTFPPSGDPQLRKAVEHASKARPEKPIVLVLLDKRFEWQDASSIRKPDDNQYSWGRPSAIEAEVYLAGGRIEAKQFLRDRTVGP